MKCFCFDLWQHWCWASLLLYGFEIQLHFVQLLLNWIGSQESNSCLHYRRSLNQPLKTHRQQPCCCLCENDNYKGLHKNCWHIPTFIPLKTNRGAARHRDLHGFENLSQSSTWMFCQYDFKPFKKQSAVLLAPPQSFIDTIYYICFLPLGMIPSFYTSW